MKNNLKSWFTLIELIVSISILGIIMVSIFTIFQLASEANNKTDISRAMQENIKNIVETIAEDVRVNNISWLNSDVTNSSCVLSWDWYYLTWTKLCIWTNKYYLAQIRNDVYNRVTDFNQCEIWKDSCVLVKEDWDWIFPLSNSWVEFRNINFSVLNYNDNKEKKLVLNFIMQPSTKKGIKSGLIKENKIIFQTTFSQRLYKSY